MKISRIKLENFKRFGTLEIHVTNSLTKDISNQFLMLGDNGTGKTTVLQAVALCLSMISGNTRQVAEFDWQGWVSGRYEKWGAPIIELDVHFSDDEIASTREAAKLWFGDRNEHADAKDFIQPGNSKIVTVRLNKGYYSVVNGSQENIFQFRGRMYASQLVNRGVVRARELFSMLPGVFWFDQYRNLASYQQDGESKEHHEKEIYAVGVSRLRYYLNGWWMNRYAGGGTQTDWLMELENSYKRVFPGRSFSGPEPMFKGGTPTPGDYYFVLSDGNRTYDIEEMSAGEQSVFPMLYEFVRMQIRNSIVLIDEIDLNLHPPLAQSLLVALPNIGPNCQFLLTTHSETISSLISSEETYRFQGGRLCL